MVVVCCRALDPVAVGKVLYLACAVVIRAVNLQVRVAQSIGIGNLLQEANRIVIRLNNAPTGISDGGYLVIRVISILHRIIGSINAFGYLRA